MASSVLNHRVYILLIYLFSAYVPKPSRSLIKLTSVNSVRHSLKKVHNSQSVSCYCCAVTSSNFTNAAKRIIPWRIFNLCIFEEIKSNAKVCCCLTHFYYAYRIKSIQAVLVGEVKTPQFVQANKHHERRARSLRSPYQ